MMKLTVVLFLVNPRNPSRTLNHLDKAGQRQQHSAKGEEKDAKEGSGNQREVQASAICFLMYGSGEETCYLGQRVTT